MIRDLIVIALFVAAVVSGIKGWSKYGFERWQDRERRERREQADRWRAECLEWDNARRPQSAERYIVGVSGGGQMIEASWEDAMYLAAKESLHNGGREVYISGGGGMRWVYLHGRIHQTFR